jgi:hypothetical protein
MVEKPCHDFTILLDAPCLTIIEFVDSLKWNATENYSPKLYNSFYSERESIVSFQYFDRNFCIVRTTHSFTNQDRVVN